MSLFKAFAEPVRLRLLALLSGGREVCVCHLHEALDLPQPTVSRHLAYLRKSGWVEARKEGLWVHYRLAKSSSILHRHLNFCIETCAEDVVELRRDRERLAQVSACCDK
ncbi:MAG: metalloregulator ArsR/SmtB family transcription factor [Isosphaeraceae bacterium]|nr:metalloregulator ArsR/SmtB family transcription factor [Isosphaeraceae bacterium]